MDDDQFSQFMRQLEGSTIATREAVVTLVASAQADREASTRSLANLANAMARGSSGVGQHRDLAKTETVDQVLKTEKDATTWVDENPSTPETDSASLWKAEFKEKLAAAYS